MRAQRDAQALGALLAEMGGCLPAHTELPPDLCSDVLLMPLPSKRPPPPSTPPSLSPSPLSPPSPLQLMSRPCSAARAPQAARPQPAQPLPHQQPRHHRGPAPPPSHALALVSHALALCRRRGGARQPARWKKTWTRERGRFTEKGWGRCWRRPRARCWRVTRRGRGRARAGCRSRWGRGRCRSCRRRVSKPHAAHTHSPRARTSCPACAPARRSGRRSGTRA